MITKYFFLNKKMQNYMYKKTFGDTLKEKASEYLIGFLAFVIVIIVFYIVIKNWMNGTWFSKLSGSFGRGVGKIPGSCPSGQEKNGALRELVPYVGKNAHPDIETMGLSVLNRSHTAGELVEFLIKHAIPVGLSGLSAACAGTG